MSHMDNLYQQLVDPSPDPPPPPGRKNVTLRLPLETHRQLDNIRALSGDSKTVAAEEVIISAIKDVHERLANDPRLEDFWFARSIEQAEERDREHDEALQLAEQRHYEEQEAEHRAMTEKELAS